MPKVTARENEDLDSLLRRFKKQVKSAEIIEECRRREFFIPKALKRKIKSEKARIKNRKKK